MNKSKKIVACVLVSCIVIPSSSADYTTTKWTNTLAAAGIILGSALLLQFDDYESHSNERLGTKIQDLYDTILFDYQEEFGCIKSVHNPVHVDESVLYQLACAKRSKRELQQYRTQIRRYKTKLVHGIDELKYRLIEENKSIGSLVDLLESAQDLLKEITLLCSIFAHHHPYFELYEKENEVWSYYANELALLYDTSLHYYDLNAHLSTVIEKRIRVVWQSFPFTTYASELHDTITRLESTLAITPLKYSKRASAAQQLIDKLYYLEGQLLAHPTYEYELSRW